jgi:hypothetical protein
MSRQGSQVRSSTFCKDNIDTENVNKFFDKHIFIFKAWKKHFFPTYVFLMFLSLVFC